MSSARKMSTAIQYYKPHNAEPDHDLVEADTDAASKVGDVSSEDSGSEDEDGDEESERVSVKDMLTQVLREIRDEELDLTDSQKLAAFVTHRGPNLARQTRDRDQPTALHIIAKEDKKLLPNLDEKMEPLIKFLCQQKNYLEIKDRSGCTSLFLAIEQRKKSLVQWMCEAHPDISSIISIVGSRGMNCLHIGIHKRIKFLDLLIEKAKPEVLAAKDDNGNTPLHLAVDYENCKREQLQYVKMMLDKGDRAIFNSTNGDFNKANLSPYRCHKESVRKGRKKLAEEAEKPGKEAESVPNCGMSSSVPSILSPNSSMRHEMRDSVQVDHRTKYGGSITIQPSVPIASPAPSIVPDAGENSKKKTTGESGTNKSKKGKKSGSKSDPVDETIVKGVERLLKLHYLRSRDCTDAMEILYGKNTPSDKELSFDLSGMMHPDETLTQKGLTNLLRNINFEDTLQYVWIPRITVEEPQQSKSRTSMRKQIKPVPDGAGRSDLVHVFNQLRNKGVETVLRVFVQDSDPNSPSHSDEAIEKALQGMGVEVWDWNKTDLCTEVIVNVAPKAREIHLYWSGNNAVLRGWSEPGGLAKLTELGLVKLHIQQGLESSVRTEYNVNEFQDRMKLLCPKVEVELEWPNAHRKRTDKTPARAEEVPEHTTKHEWIQCMTDFRKLVFEAEANYPMAPGTKISEMIEPIQVAIIDDGVDIKDLDYDFTGGRSFCIRSEHRGLLDPYYMSRTGHGTIMAKNIHLMCPHASLFILRLEDTPSEDGTKLNITARSAAKAIRAAIVQGVQIISMSWTIDPPKDDRERQDLENAVIEAANANILMFCSASDKGAHDVPTYPSKAATGKIFTIGAANSSGASVDYVGNTSGLSYTFPGDKVEVDSGPSRKTPPEIVDGSSVATALAAGLAALILYCIQVRVFLAKDSEKQRAREAYRKVKQHDWMVKAFDTIETTKESNHKFLKVWEVFGKCVEQKEQTPPGEWLQLVADVGTRLCVRIY
ncbi:related to microbial serine proteinase [Fusarium fujikuroi IMI 58289]|uniref:Related to microbial serine proteinase n=1 Tax=Gibberella fujikuroi (strain CBS 195.34 / IMI 58289 / NRRL A-6831) TaxID=1279085 RepID=S0EA93_GIBF5|nr:related to microbial serine proteinase [Fusarium fujikuroi IMI 58289]CCT70672.1 related to microbial serine proteinase [Fusarium fujikuroi IMI 58289]SCN83004.1 related to microbial serine proteinase [Fusarium fujikuroi]